jgi:DnaJ-class molecular chaperone
MGRNKVRRPRRVGRPCRVCRGAGSFVIAGEVVVCARCKGTGRARNK